MSNQNTSLQRPNPGPTTAAGKAIACGNATKHGGAAQRLIIEGESRDDFNELLASLNEHYQPSNPQEQEVIQQAAEANWKLSRCTRARDVIEYEIYTTLPDVTQWTAAEFNRIHLADRYKTAAENSFGRALKNLMLITKQRQNQFRWEAMQELAHRRLELQKERHALAVQRHEAKQASEAAREKAKAAQAMKQPVRSVKCAISSPQTEPAIAAQPNSPAPADGILRAAAANAS